MPGEFDFIRHLIARHPARGGVVVPIGDDLAAVRWDAGDLLLAGADQVLEGVHFTPDADPRLVGRKVVNRNVSDCAAMACLPAYFVVTIAARRGIGEAWLRSLHDGMDEAAGAVDTQIVGGDTGSWTGPTAVSVTVIGRSAGVTPVTRGGARVGDFLHVTGPLGGSIVGRHLTFTPRLSLGRQLGAGRVATAMIDLSDGLSRDLSHVCRASGVGAIVETSRVPIHDDARQLPGDALGHALHDGEDYELLFTSPREQVDGATRIGRIVAGDAIELERVDGSRVPLVARAWQHVL